MKDVKTVIPWLGAALAAQLALGWYALSRKEVTAVFKSSVALLDFSPEKVTEIAISTQPQDGQRQELTLTQDQGKWMVRDGEMSVPAETSKINSFLGTLAGFHESYPVGRTEVTAKQFKVGSEIFERRIDLKAGDKTAALVLGSSPSFKKLYARRGDDPATTFVVSFNLYEAPMTRAEWVSKSELNVEAGDVARLEFRDIQLEPQGSGFALVGLGPNEESQEAKVADLTKKMLSPSYSDILGPAEAHDVGASRLAYTVNLQDGTKRDYIFALSKADAEKKDDASDKPESYVLKVSGMPYAFKVAAYTVDTLGEVRRSELVRSKTATTSPSADDTSEAAPSSLPADSNKHASNEGGDIAPSEVTP